MKSTLQVLQEPNQGDDDKDPEDQNIGSSNHCNGSLLTLSFIVQSRDVIKMYLYYNGGMIRFFPDDIKTVLPKIFNMDYGRNKQYIEKNQELDRRIQEMNGKVVDVEFAKFQSNCKL